jgi:putative hydroxymethylpyrimidine transport system substrate-binding protein
MAVPSRSACHRRQFIRRAAAGLVGMTALSRFSRGVLAAEKVTVALDWYPNADHAGLYVAQAAGTFTAAGLNVDLYTPSDPTVVLQTVGAGKDTFGISYQTDVLLARAQGVPVVSIAALVQHPLVCVMSLTTKGITRPADLKGKTVGYPGIPSQEAYLATMLKTDGLSMSDIELIDVEFDLVPAVISGKVDAVMGAYRTHETIVAEQQGYPVDVMPVEQWGVPDFYELVMVASEETVAKRSDLLRAFLGAVVSGYAAAIADPAGALDTLAAAYPEIDRAVEQRGLALLIPAWTAGVPAFGTQTPQRWRAYGDWMKSQGLIPADLDVAKAFTSDLLPPVAATPTPS